MSHASSDKKNEVGPSCKGGILRVEFSGQEGKETQEGKDIKNFEE